MSPLPYCHRAVFPLPLSYATEYKCTMMRLRTFQICHEIKIHVGLRDDKGTFSTSAESDYVVMNRVLHYPTHHAQHFTISVQVATAGVAR